MTDPYAHLLIDDYLYWELYLHEQQHYLGRCYAWLKRPGKIDLTDLLIDELNELHQLVLPDVKRDLQYEFDLNMDEDLINYAWMANNESHGHHGHMHIIPRYKHQRIFNGMPFIDTNWGNNYAPYPKSHFHPHDLDKIVAGMKQHHIIDKKIEEWHNGDSTLELHEFLGMTIEQYQEYFKFTGKVLAD